MAERIDSNESYVLLQMEGICKRFGGTVALEDVGIRVTGGEVLALVGENGAGKSTLMKVVSGAIRADRGKMRLGGVDYQPGSPLEARRAGVAMIYQELSLAGHLSVEENIMLGMEPARLGVVRWKEVRSRAVKALKDFDNPELTAEARVSRLSVGSQQLVEIARALAIGCRVLVLDEPTSSLTRQDADRLFEIIQQLKHQGKAIVYISHFIEEINRIADRVTVLRDGKVVGTSDVSGLTTEKIIAQMVGREVKELYPRSERQVGEVVLEIKDLGGIDKPESASLQLRRGQILGIAGLVGAGRTELLRTLFGLDAVRNGEIRIGFYTGPASPVRRWAQGVGFLSEDRKEEGLALSMTISDNMTLSKLKGFGPLGFVFPSRQARASQWWIERLGIRCGGPKDLISSLSGGNQQKVAIARLLQHDVDVLLLDEPTRGVDVASKAMIYKLIDELAVDSKAVLMVSSYLPELMGICDGVAVMCRGRLGASRGIDEVDEHKLMSEATGQEIKA
ncbi:MAG: sugar ABC transporter ATP-binding protein [Planctomycetota bacterium]|jgi:ribose transport system ATP-binding protein